MTTMAVALDRNLFLAYYSFTANERMLADYIGLLVTVLKVFYVNLYIKFTTANWLASVYR